MNKVIIVRPKLPVSGLQESCLSLLYLGTALKKAGYKVVLIDGEHENAAALLREQAKDAFCVGITAMTVHIKEGLELTNIAKEINRNLPVVWGGTHATLFPGQVAMYPLIDYVIQGEGESAFIELLSCLESGKEFVSSKKFPYVDLNSLSPPAWELIDMTRYIYNDPEVGERCIRVNTGRGCSYLCKFCINTLFKPVRWRPLSAENIVNEVKLLKEKYGIKSVRFTDENFFTNKYRVKEFCELYIKENIGLPWVAFGRVDYFNENHLNKELLELVKESGCKTMRFGVESGSKRILDMINKGTTPEQVENAVSLCGEYGIKPVCLFMVGMPGETEKDMLLTVKHIVKLSEINPNVKIVGPQVFRPYPGSEMYNELKENYGYVEPVSLEEWAANTTPEHVMFSDFLRLEELPWITNPGFVENLLFYAGVFQFHPSETGNKFKRFSMALLKPFAWVRMKSGYFGLPIEKVVFCAVQKLFWGVRNAENKE